MKPMIEFCLNNIANYSHSAYELLISNDELDVLEYSCTSNCELCAQTLFCVVEGEIVTGTSTDELVENVYSYIKENTVF